MSDQSATTYASIATSPASLVYQGAPFQFRMWHFLPIIGVIVATSMAIYPVLPRTYTSTASVWVRLTDQEGHATGDQSIRDQLDDNAIQTKSDIIRSSPLQKLVIEQNHLLDDPEFNPLLQPSWVRENIYPWLTRWLPQRRPSDAGDLVETNLRKHLIIKRDHKSYLLQIGYESKDPEKAAKLANTVVAAFFDDQLARKRDAEHKLLAGFEQRVAILKQLARLIENAERSYLTTTGLVHRGEIESAQRRLGTLSDAVASARARVVEADDRAEMLATIQKSGGLDNASEALASPLLQHLRERLVGLTTGAGAGSSGVPSGLSPAIAAEFRQGIATETQRLVKAAQNDAIVARQNEVQLLVEIARIDTRLMVWHAAEREGQILHSEVVATEGALATALKAQMDETGRDSVLQPDAELISAAEPPVRQSFPDPLLYLGGTATLAALACMLILMMTGWKHRAR